MKRILAAAALLATVIAAPASAVTLVAGFTDAAANTTSVTKSNISLGVTVSVRRFFVTPTALTTFGQTSAPTATQLLTRTAAGLGIVGGGSGTQMDTNSAGSIANPLREAYLVTGTDAFYLTGLALTSVDSDDTLQIYGVNGDDSLVGIGFDGAFSAANNNPQALLGTIRGGLNGDAIGLVNTGANGGTSTFSFINQSRFTRYLITTREGGEVVFLGEAGQGFALQGLTATVPEPATWGMLIVGFGLVGVAARRRNTAVAARS